MDLPPPSRPEAGWFPDPWLPGRVRYWDGERWTPHVATPRPPESSATSAEAAGDATIPLHAGLVGLAVLPGAFLASVVVQIVLAVVGLPDPVVVLGAAAGLYGVLVWWCQQVARRYGTGRLAADLGLRLQRIDLLTGVGTWLAAAFAQGAVVLVLHALGAPLGSNSDFVRESTNDATQFLAVALIAVVVAPIVEELYFRGLLLRSFQSRLSPATAVVAQALIFGLIHFRIGLGRGNITLVLALATVGAVFGVAASWARRLGPAIVGHACFNLVAVLVVLGTS